MSVIVTDAGFAPDDWTGEVTDLPSDADVDTLEALAEAAPPLVRIAFPSFADGRGFTLARVLRMHGYAGRLRAHGHVIADQYAMARRAGFDEVEIPDDLAARQPEAQWLARADWRAFDHRSRLRAPLPAGARVS
jgi:uncharacterized protein (DUF934 family)